MVQICVKSASRHGCLQEYFIIEVQGDLLSKSNEGLANSFIGDLHFNKQGVPILIVGHHILFGTCTKIEKPLAILTKRVPIGNDISDCSQNEVKSTEYCADAVIRSKLVFRQRPKPIVVKKS